MPKSSKNLAQFCIENPDYQYLVDEWYADLNKCNIDKIAYGTSKLYYWKCNRGHIFKQSPVQRRRGYQCPYCRGKKVLKGFNDLSTLFPALAKEWHPSKNGLLSPDQVSPGSRKKVWWLCPKGHEYAAFVFRRTSKQALSSHGNGCPYCAKKKKLYDQSVITQVSYDNTSTDEINIGDNFMAKKIIVFSFFSGSGFLDLGFEKNGFEIDLVNEYHPEFMRAYKYSREKMGMRIPRFGYYNIDINEFLQDRKEELKRYISKIHSEGNIVGFIGGPPCPDFSIAGKNRGRNGDNGKLSKSYVDLITTMKPDFFLFENVKGLWKTKRHREFYDELKCSIQNADYSVTDRLTNALEFGAPQDRDRIFLFGIQNKHISSTQQSLDFPWHKYIIYDSDDVKKLPWPETDLFSEGLKTECPSGVLENLTVEHWFRKNDVENHPNSKDYFTPHGGLQRMQSIPEGDVSRKSYKRLHRWRYSPTVAYGNNEVHLHPYHARRLSAAEALSLQTLPKEFQLPDDMTLTDMFKTIGNGVPFLLSSGIAKTIHDYLTDLED